jgi:hypothetical protein
MINQERQIGEMLIRTQLQPPVSRITLAMAIPCLEKAYHYRTTGSKLRFILLILGTS